MKKKNYATRCWVNEGMVPFSGGLTVTDEGFSFNLKYPFGSDDDPMEKMMQKGMFTPLCKPDKYDSAEFKFIDIENAVLGQWSDGDKFIKMIINNRSRGKKINIQIVIDRSASKGDNEEIVRVYELLKTKTK